MRTVNKVVILMSIIIFPILLTLDQDSLAGEFIVKNKDWTIKISSPDKL